MNQQNQQEYDYGQHTRPFMPIYFGIKCKFSLTEEKHAHTDELNI